MKWNVFNRKAHKLDLILFILVNLPRIFTNYRCRSCFFYSISKHFITWTETWYVFTLYCIISYRKKRNFVLLYGMDLDIQHKVKSWTSFAHVIFHLILSLFRNHYSELNFACIEGNFITNFPLPSIGICVLFVKSSKAKKLVKIIWSSGRFTDSKCFNWLLIILGIPVVWYSTC